MINDMEIDGALVVRTLSGHVACQRADGERADVVEGDRLHLGDLLIVEPGSRVEVGLPSGELIQLGSGSLELLSCDRSVLDHASSAQHFGIAPETMIEIVENHASSFNDFSVESHLLHPFG